jgi:tRNA-specific 2-thiouridylase
VPGQDIHDAKRVAERLGIPHYVLDYEERFRRSVMDDFAAAYARGETPIPCVRCNERIKFGDLLTLARELGADALATGHYVRRVDGTPGPELHCAADQDRDQSYFLFATTREQLASLRFPLGALPKTRVREMAQELGLSVAAKPDSQDVCFVPQGRYSSVVRRLRPDAEEPGDIVDVQGRVSAHILASSISRLASANIWAFREVPSRCSCCGLTRIRAKSLSDRARRSVPETSSSHT